MVKGFTHKLGINYNEIFFPGVKYLTLRVILALVAHYELEREQMDLKTAFIHGNLDKTIY